MKRNLERFFAMIGVISCLGACLYVFQVLSPPAYRSSIWPFPGLYLIEMAILGIIGLVSVIADNELKSTHWGAVTWCSCGGLLAFVVMGAMSIGLLFLPAVVAFGCAAMLADISRNRSIIRHLGLFVSATIIQAGLMLIVILAMVRYVQSGSI